MEGYTEHKRKFCILVVTSTTEAKKASIVQKPVTHTLQM